MDWFASGRSRLSSEDAADSALVETLNGLPALDALDGFSSLDEEKRSRVQQALQVRSMHFRHFSIPRVVNKGLCM